MAKFKQAIKWLKEGEKVRRKSWMEEHFWEFCIICEDSILNSANQHIDDWELYGKKTLSDKIIWGNSPSDARYNELDVKKRIEEFLESGFNWRDENDVRIKTKEIFGERLIK